MPSLRRTRKSLQKNLIRWTLWLSIFFIFVVGTFTTFGFLEGPSAGISLTPAVARVNDWDIPRDEYERSLAAHLSTSRPEAGDWMRLKQSVLEDLILDRLIQQEAQRRRIRVSGADLEQLVDLRVQLEMASVRDRFAKNKAFRDYIRDRFGSLEAYERARRDQYLHNRSEDQRQILLSKLMGSMMEEVTVTDEDLERFYTRYRLTPLLIDWVRFLPRGSEGSEQDRKKAEEQAIQRARSIADRWRKGESLLSVARDATGRKDLKKEPTTETVSHDSLTFRFGEEGAKVIARLKPGEISDPIRSPSGYYVVRLEGRKVDWPKDINQVRYECEDPKCRHIFLAGPDPKECPKCKGRKIKKLETRREELRNQLKQMRGQEKWFQLLERLRKEAKIEIYDWDLIGADRARAGQTQEAIDAYEEAVKQITNEADARRHFFLPEALHYELSRLYMNEGKIKVAEKEVKKALTYTEEDYSLLIQEGHLYLLQGKKAEALKVFQRVSTGSPRADQRRQLASFYQQLGRRDLAEKERKEAEQMEKEASPLISTR